MARSTTVALHTQAKQLAARVDGDVELPLSLPYLLTHSPWPEHELVWVMQLLAEAKHCGMGLVPRAEEEDAEVAAGLAVGWAFLLLFS